MLRWDQIILLIMHKFRPKPYVDGENKKVSPAKRIGTWNIFFSVGYKDQNVALWSSLVYDTDDTV